MYDHKKTENNVYKFVFERKMPQLSFPDRLYEASMDPVFTPDLLNYFFHQKSDIFKQLSSHEKLAIFNLYPTADYRNVLPIVDLSDIRSENRFVASPKGVLLLEGVVSILQTLDVSKNGLCLKGNLLGLKEFELKVLVNSTTEAKLKVERRWVDEVTQMSGVKIIDSDMNWQNYIDFLEGQFQQKKLREAI